MKITFYGGAEEVGRSCIMISTENTKILLDAGVKLGEKEEYPMIEDRMLSEIDGVFVTHAHLDHCAYLPHLYSAGYKNPTFATKPTIELTNVLISDYMHISNPKNVTKEGLERLRKSYKIIEYKKKMRLKDLEIEFIPAGHIVGSAMIRVSDGRKSILYTGDLHLTRTRLLEGANVKGLNSEILITESTYASKSDVFPGESKIAKEMLKSINETIDMGGKIIIPSFAVGRAQEVLLFLDDYINSGVMRKVPIYVDGMINKSMRIYRHNVIYCREELQKKILMSDYDPFKSNNFVPVEKRGMRNKIASEDQSSIIVTTSGMLTGGPVMFYLSKLAQNPANKLILVGYQAEGTLGRALLEGTKSIRLNGKEINVEMSVENYHLSAHADRRQLEMLLASIGNLKKVFIVHGEKSKAEEFRRDIAGKYEAIVPKLEETFDV
ncbi:MAG: MBL fold metallo-hydrolase RNA specificity domain-containing protein [Candidatus Micrarchaeia archaeon]